MTATQLFEWIYIKIEYQTKITYPDPTYTLFWIIPRIYVFEVVSRKTHNLVWPNTLRKQELFSPKNSI